ncbi:MAG: 3-isopropylmalate dehydratase small subunit [Gammaproteobacteria bacterium]|nr:3-isopropylmalate dehydratase small subunit [Gammaproteobacteria bacterium]
MEKFTVLEGIVAPLDRANVDTDAIIPKQFLKSIKRTGFGPNLFDEWRYLDHGEPGMDNSTRPLNPEFVLNQPRYRNARILLARDNFGCGSSREHAPWALLDYGFRCVIAPSFAEIFFNNCFKNGILPVVVSNRIVEDLFSRVDNEPGFAMRVDLAGQVLALPDHTRIEFEVDPYRKHALINGLDDIGLTLEKSELIVRYEQHRKAVAPWLFSQGD